MKKEVQKRGAADKPNMVLILLDDLGFADTSTFGGFAKTPELNRLAAQGLRYNNFNTAGVCAPTRAALMSGRNQHRVGFGGFPIAASGSPGYHCLWPKSAAAIPEVLRLNGYATAAFGKWHNTPIEDLSPVGPFDRWPTGMGFDYFYGFQEAQENQWEPSGLFRNTVATEPIRTPDREYHLTADIVDEAIHWLHAYESVGAERPYFLYLATGAVHAPHHVPREWIEPYRGRFDNGWDELRVEIFARQKTLGVIPPETQLTARPAEIPAWNALTCDQRKLYARQMEVYAGFVAHTDHEVGRLLRAVAESSNAQNTLTLYIAGDNGSAGEGGIDGQADGMTSIEEALGRIDDLGGQRVALNLYSTGWAWMGNTPFKWWKAVASHFGGVRDPMIVSWPSRIRDPGGLRAQFTHANDVAATLYEVAGITLPNTINGVEQMPLDGASFADTFDNPEARSRHHTQYFETFGNRAMYQNGWIAAALHAVPLFHAPFNGSNDDYVSDSWELYCMETDFSQSVDLALREPEKLQELQELFDVEAQKNNIYPLGASYGRPSESPLRRKMERLEWTFHPDVGPLQFSAMPSLEGRSYRITADAMIPGRGAQGVIVAFGSRGAGVTLYVKDDRLVYESNFANVRHDVIAANVPLRSGEAELMFEFSRTEGLQQTGLWAPRGSGGIGRLFVNSNLVGLAEIVNADPMRFPGAFSVGRAYGSPVSLTYEPPFAFTGTLRSVKVEII